MRKEDDVGVFQDRLFEVLTEINFGRVLEFIQLALKVRLIVWRGLKFWLGSDSSFISSDALIFHTFFT